MLCSPQQVNSFFTNKKEYVVKEIRCALLLTLLVMTVCLFDQLYYLGCNLTEELLARASKDMALQNPLLECLADILKGSLEGSFNSRGILFCKTRAVTEALVAWIEDTPSLRFLQPGRLIGGGGSEGG